MNFRWMIISLILWPNRTLQRSNHDSPSYMAAVVEYSPVMEYVDQEDLGDMNAENYLKIIDKATGYGIDVIVFPEDSLSISSAISETTRRSQAASYIPDPAAKIIPCNDKSKRYKSSLKSISCAAKDHQIYVVINHRERVDCTSGKGCPADGLLIYNTNVAFDREGRVVARYRKYNLYFKEHNTINVTQPISTTFETDFGVIFGTFICFDLLFQTPTLNLIRDLNVTDILYPTHWYSILPNYYAVEAQAAWAYANDVNFLASGLHDPRTSSGGSGIYLGKQGYVEIISERRGPNVLLVAEIPKVINGKRTRAINRDKLHVYEFTNEEIPTKNEKWIYILPKTSNVPTELIDLNEKDQNKTICHTNLCCNFKLTIDFDRDSIKNNSHYYRYRFVINVLTNTQKIGFQSCGIVACTNDTEQSCGRVFDDYENAITPITFTSLEITTQNITKKNTFFMPMTFLQTMLPLNVTDFSFESQSVSDEFSVHQMKLKNPVKNLLTFAIYGRDFTKDHVRTVSGISRTSWISPILLFAVILANI